MNTRNKKWKKVLMFAVPLLLVALVAGRLVSNKKATQAKVYQYSKEQAISITAQRLVSETITEGLYYTGTFEPNRESKLSSEQPGKINALYADVGSVVGKGQRLVQLDNALLQQQLNAVNVQLNNARTEYQVQLNANRILIDGLRQDVQRYRILAKEDAIQGVQLEKAEQQLQTAENQRTAIIQQSGIRNLEAQRSSIQTQISKSAIYAPFSGVVTAKLSEVGAYAAPGVPLLQLSDISTLRFTINVSERDLFYFRDQQQLYPIELDAGPLTKVSGRIIMTGSRSNMGNSFPVQFQVGNIDGNAIKAGMFGKVKVHKGMEQSGIVIPASALQSTAELPEVFVVQKGRALRKPITTGQRLGDKIVVADGLHAGDTLVTGGFSQLFDSAYVRIK